MATPAIAPAERAWWLRSGGGGDEVEVDEAAITSSVVVPSGPTDVERLKVFHRQHQSAGDDLIKSIRDVGGNSH